MDVKKAQIYIVDKHGKPIIAETAVYTKIGRKNTGSNAGIQLDSTITSTNHGEIQQLEGQFFYRDIGSTNGTIVNGKHIGLKHGQGESVHRLNNGDIIKIDGVSKRNTNPEAVLMIFFTDTSEKRPVTLSCNTPPQGFKYADGIWTVLLEEKDKYLNKRKLYRDMQLKRLDVVEAENGYYIVLDDNMLMIEKK